MPRKYTKKSDYWNKFNKPQQVVSEASGKCRTYSLGAAYHVSEASYDRSEL